MTYPLFIVTGPSGSGKSTIVKELRKEMSKGFNLYDMDYIVNDQDYQTACNNWMRVSYFNSLNGNITILFGAVPFPYDVNKCDYFYHFDPVHYMLLHCSDSSRIQRLNARGGWSPKALEDTNAYAQRLRDAALAKSDPVIDTSITSVSEAVVQIQGWVKKHLKNNK
ncbi:AAA family ATPase [Paenibacillus sp. YIM B09110]|uniref:AAA family ATPase n=1 Tax=Paenibacillus sp. YIM B09110 TaxID=3126102 RepID=UPI00301D6DF4